MTGDRGIKLVKNIPTSLFNSGELESKYIKLFEDKLGYYKFLMNKVKEELYDHDVKYLNLSGNDIAQIRQITDSIIKMTNAEFSYSCSETESSLHGFSLGE